MSLNHTALLSTHPMIMLEHRTALKPLSAEKLQFAASVLKSVANPCRLQILQLLEVNTRLSVGQLSEILNVELSLVYHHLNNLKDQGILEAQKERQAVYYQIAMPQVLQLLRCVEHCCEED